MNFQNTLMPLSSNSGKTVALGYFDGVHLGHRAVINSAVQFAKQHSLESAVFTFALDSKVKGKAILPIDEKLQRIESLGVQHCVCPRFALFHNFSPEEFVCEILIKTFNAKAVFCGDNFTFGVHKSGNTALLKALCESHGIELYVVPMAQIYGDNISSTNIRTLLQNGEMEKVNQMLGVPYSINFIVSHGKGLGKTLGVPTVNQIYSAEMLIPKSGVYITRINIRGVYYTCATGIGSRPTVDGNNITCESFINGFDEEVYGETVRLEFYKYLFETKKYNNLEELKAMILGAAKQSEAFFAQLD